MSDEPSIVRPMANRTQRAAVFASGLFDLGLVPMMTVAVPLRVPELGAPGPVAWRLLPDARAAA